MNMDEYGRLVKVGLDSHPRLNIHPPVLFLRQWDCLNVVPMLARIPDMENT